ncbi:SirB2 family protein [Chromobacterium amazonense]|uniref:SirB2 family protein n=1 Tax=Chromobacterium amazonense TaxID=1382803 RepID=UPI003F7947BF
MNQLHSSLCARAMHGALQNAALAMYHGRHRRAAPYSSLSAMYPYLIVKHAHMGFAILSILLFAARGALVMGGRGHLLQSKPLRIAPHVIDTLLLGCAIALVAMGGWPILHSPWLLAKIIGLVAYVALGTIALRGATPKSRRLAFFAALAVVAYILLVAKTKMVLPLL